MRLNRIISLLAAFVIAVTSMSATMNAATEKKSSIIDRLVDAITSIGRKEDAKDEYKSPIDFKYYQKKNSDIYGWIKIEGTDVDYPLLQSEDDDEYYLKHTWKKKSSKYGSIYTESTYNGKDFSDPVTLIYGHRMNDGSMFGKLQEIYSDRETFDECNEIVIYLPDEELHYEVFASLPYSNAHILYNYDFASLRMSKAFFKTIFSAKGAGVNINEDAYSGETEGIVILSTCLKGNNKKRYLVLAQLTERIGKTKE